MRKWPKSCLHRDLGSKLSSPESNAPAESDEPPYSSNHPENRISMTLFSLTPTFTQGLVLGQLSILLLLAFILRYLFFDTTPPPLSEDDETSGTNKPPEGLRVRPSLFNVATSRPAVKASPATVEEAAAIACGKESVEWFNFLLANVRLHYLYNSRAAKMFTSHPLDRSRSPTERIFEAGYLALQATKQRASVLKNGLKQPCRLGRSL